MHKNKYSLMRDREIMLSPSYWVPSAITHPEVKKLYGIKYQWHSQIYHKDRLRVVLATEEFQKIETHIAKNLFNKKGYFSKIKTAVEQREKRLRELLESLSEKDFEKTDFERLVQLCHKIKHHCMFYEFANVPAWAYAGDKLQELIKNDLGVPDEDFLVLSTPEIKTAISQLEHDELFHSITVKKKKNDLDSAAKKLAEEYGWIPHGFDGPDYWDEKHFAKRLEKVSSAPLKKLHANLQKITAKEQRKLKNKKKIALFHNLSSRQIELVERLNTVTVWTDQRRGLTFKAYSYYNDILKELEKRFGLPYKNLKYLFTKELALLKKDFAAARELSQKRVAERFVVDFKNGEYEIIGKEARDKFLEELKIMQEKKEIKGMIASIGPKKLYRGKAKILLSPKEVGKVDPGDFIVATMTTPDYMIAMNKAQGFVTDEGGVTCHAAIVARELNKPCIIGTGSATKLLSDDDTIEMDTNKGTVQVIKKSK